MIFRRHYFAIFLCILCIGLVCLNAQQANDVDEETTTLQFPKNSVEDILRGYEILTGKHLIEDANLATGTQLSIVVPNPVPKSEAIKLIESALLLNGYAIIPLDSHTVKVINAAGGKNPRSEGLPIYATPASLPKSEGVVVYFMTFRYLTTAEAAPIFQQQIALHPGYGSIVPAANAQALIITENVSVIRQMIQLQSLIDVPPARIVSQFVSLQRADAERVADAITKLLARSKNASSETTSSAPATPPAGSIPPQDNNATQTPNPNGEAAGEEVNSPSLLANQVQLVPDPRTNRILVVTRPIHFDYIRDLILQFDQAATLVEPYERALKYVPAGEILPVLQTALSESAQQAASSESTSTTSASNRSSNSSSTSVNSPPGNPGSAITTTTSNSPGTTGDENLLGQITADQDTAPSSVIVGKTRIIADKRSNSIIIIGPPESIAKMSALLDRLDKKPRQVFLATVIGQLQLSKNDEFGIDILQKYARVAPGGGFATGLRTRSNTSGMDTVPEPSTLNTTPNFPLPPGLTLYGEISSTIEAYVKALEASNHFKVIARPSVYTANNKEAVISSGQEVPVPSSTLSTLNTGTVNNAAVTSNIDFRKVVLELKVVPLINADREVTLQIAQKNDSLGANEVISGITVPIINTQQVGTTVTVPNKSTVVLGGLISKQATKDVTGIPFLSDIPGLGYLFKDTVHSYERVELIILIQPTVIESQEELEEQNKLERQGYKIGNESKEMAQPLPIKPLKKD